MTKRTNSVSRGNAALPILFLLITIGILAAGGYFVYKTVTNGQVPNPLTAVQKLQDVTGSIASSATRPKISENDFSFIEDPLVRKHMAAQANVTKYRTTSTSSGLGANEEMVSEIDMSTDTLKMRTIRNEKGKEVSHTIDLGDTTYAKDYSDGKWWKETIKPGPTPTGEPDQKVLDWKPEDIKQEMTKEKVTYTKLGEEACGKLMCYKYKEQMGEVTRDFWFDKNQFLLRKQVAAFGEFSSTMEFSYDNVSLTAPSPTKDVPAGKSIWEMSVPLGGADAGSGLPSSKDMESLKKTIDSMKIPADQGNNPEPPPETPDQSAPVDDSNAQM